METRTKKYVSVAVVMAAAVFGMVLAGSLGLTPGTFAEPKPPAVTAQHAGARTGVMLPNFADIAEQVMPAVVSITTTEIVKGPAMRRYHGGGQDPFEFFFGPQGPNSPRMRPSPQDEGDDDEDERQQKAGGTGFIIDPEGYIITNNHVVEDASKIEVKLFDKVVYKGKVVGRDAATDLALVKIDAGKNLPYLEMGDSTKVRVGEWVMAIGDPLHFDKTVTVGVVSAKGRALGFSEESRSFENFIQTDAAINFGNSGGPLLNVDGQVIGINTAISRMAQNIGFAVPVDIAKRVIPQLRSHGKVTRGFLGVKIRNVDTDIQKAFGLSEMRGAFVESVEAGKPADRAGVQHGDVILMVDDVKVEETRDVIDYVSGKEPGSKVRLVVNRNGKEKTLTASLEERLSVAEDKDGDEDETEPENGDAGQVKQKIGISVRELSSGLRQQYQVDSGSEGVLITKVREVSPAADAGLSEGDVIVEVNGNPVKTISAFQAEMKKSANAAFVRIYYKRFVPQKGSYFAIVRMKED